MSFPGWPLKSLDCFASTVQVAVVHAEIVTATSALTDCPLPSAIALDFARNWTTRPTTLTSNPPFVMLLTAPGAKPAGAVKFADPSDCDAFGSFVNVSVKLPGVFNVR
jgi:hypothetical protein